MPNQRSHGRVKVTRAEIIAAYLDFREDEPLDAVVTAATLVARADGWVRPVERGQLLDFLDRKEFLSIFTRGEILDVFERCVRELSEPPGSSRGGAAPALRRTSSGSARHPCQRGSPPRPSRAAHLGAHTRSSSRERLAVASAAS